MRIGDRKAASHTLSIMLLVVITFIVGMLFYNFVAGLVGNYTKPASTEPFSLRIENVTINNTCITVYVRNALDQAVTIDTAYVNNEPHAILSLSNKVTISENSTGKVFIMGSYNAGARYEIKIICTSGFTLFTMVTY